MTKLVTYIEIDTPTFANLAGNAAGFSAGNYLLRGGGLTGAADGKRWTASAWLRLSAIGSGLRWLLEDDRVNPSRLVVLADNAFEVTGINAAGTQVLRLVSSPLTVAEWVHVMFSVDLSDPQKCHL